MMLDTLSDSSSVCAELKSVCVQYVLVLARWGRSLPYSRMFVSEPEVL